MGCCMRHGAMAPADQVTPGLLLPSFTPRREILESHEATRSTAELEQIVAILRERVRLVDSYWQFKC